MQQASQTYKQSMEETARTGFCMDVAIGVVNQTAQTNAWVDMENCLDYSNPEKPFDNYDVEYTYTTMEQNFFRTDGKMLFLPEHGGPYFNAGIISKDILGPITIKFRDGPFDIKGLTIEFGAAYPVDFEISSDQNTIAISGNTDGHFVTEEIFDGATHITITPSRMAGGRQRLRIEKISMGIGIYFSNQQIKNSTKKEFLSLLTEELPTTDLSVTISNKGRKFDVENKASTIHYLEIGQKCTVRYGKILPNGTIERFDGATLNLDTWKADDDVMTFGAKDRISDLNNIYYRGKYGKISLYALAEDVLLDAGLDERQYNIDSYLQEVYVSNPMPAVTHREALQIIANAGRCILYQDRQGIIQIKAGFTTVISPERMEVQSDNAEEFSDLQSVVLQRAKYTYAMMYQNYFRVDGSMYFLPEDGEKYLTAGYVSSAVADENGKFEQNPRLTVKLEAAFSYYGVEIEFGGNPPEEVIIFGYKDGVQKYGVVCNGSIQSRMSVNYAFLDFDTMEFEFTKGYPNNAVIVNYVKFGDVSDYEFTYRNMTRTPVGEQVEKYKDVRIQMTRYANSSEAARELFKDTVDSGKVTAYMSSACYGYAVSRGKILSSSAYEVTVEIEEEDAGKELVITGHEYMQSASDYVLSLNTTGAGKSWNNPLVSESDHAAILAEWIGNYLNNNIEYDIAYRGDFRIDAGDIAFLENSYVPKLQIAVCEHTLDFSAGALKGTVKARRAQNGVDTTQNQLARRL